MMTTQRRWLVILLRIIIAVGFTCVLLMICFLLFFVGSHEDAFWSATVKTWVDENKNGSWDTNEKPLPEIRVFVDVPGNGGEGLTKVSNEQGEVRLTSGMTCRLLSGCTSKKFVVGAEAPPGYHFTTSSRIRVQDQPEGPYLFGFTSNP